ENVITLNENNGAYTYTNTVELPFKVTNTTYLWHNIYWPSNTKNNDWPVYLSASTADDTYVPKVTGSYAYGDHPTYNTKSGNNNISWAIYNVNKGFEFIFKNKVTQKYIRIRNVADEDAQNVQYVENAEDATAFTIEMKPEGQTYDTDAKYALAAMFGETKGYLCSTSVGYDWVTHYYNAINNGYGHQGAWIEFKEAPDYYSKIMDLGIMLGYKFGAGDGKYIITDAISEINDHIANNSENITLNTIKQDSIVLNDAINNWPAVGLTINPVEGGTTNINGEENVVHKYVPNGYELPLAAVPAEGYHFVSWTDGTDEVKTAEYTKTISGGKGDVIELTANFAKDSYTVAVTAEEGGSATTSVATVEHGSEVTLTATANDGYKFIGWYNGEELVDTNNPYTFAVTSDINYTAKFSESASTPTTHAIHIIVSSTDGTEVTNSENGNVKAVFEMSNDWITDYDFADGVDVILVATPDYRQQAYLFDGWYKNGVLVSNELSHPVKATEDATFEARFFRGCVIIGKSNSNRLGYIESITLADGTSMGYDASNIAAVRKGTIVKLNPRIENGYTVGNWTDVNGNVVSEDESLIIEVNEDVTYTANFEPVSYKLTVRANDDSYGTVNAVSEIESGKTIKVGNAMVATITAEANDGYKFVYWTKGTDVVSYDAEYTVPAIADVSETEDTEYVANFVELETAEPGIYYRFAYEFPAAAAASAARTGATRAAGDTYTYAVNYGTGTSNNISNGKAQEWVYTNNNNEPTLTLRATVADTPVYAINMGANATANPKLYAHGSDGNSLITPVKYTLSVPEGYIIVNYSFEYYVYNDSEFAIDGISQTRRTWLNLSVNANNQTAEFTLSSTNNTNYMIVRNFTVTIQEVGSGEGEGEGGEGGGGETPETPETVKYYIQSEACGVTNKTNALVMTQDGESASSIFYYDNNKLLSYKEGRYLDESNSARGLQAVGAAGGDVEIIDNKIKVSSGTTVVYLHANKNVGTSTTYFVDRCTSRDGNDNGDEEHNFIVEEVTTLPVTISSALHATFYAPVAVSIPEGVSAYILKSENIKAAGDYATMTPLTKGIIPANTGVILKSEEAKTYYFNITENTDEARAEAVNNVLTGTVAETNIKKDAYILAVRNSLIGLYPLNTNSYIDSNTTEETIRFTNNSHKAYLPVEGELGEVLKKSNGFRFIFDDGNTTGVEDFETELEDTIYDLQGRKLSEITQPGIYIIGGKKIFVK
ncbi:MAG: hypothetical protein J6Q73_09080, partial [Bacteroidaceae bacterium]|nr:hypothetical protein [Bacteroidaceae bacterium]